MFFLLMAVIVGLWAADFWLMAVIFGLWAAVFWLAYLSFSDCRLFGCCFWLMGRGLLVISYKP